MAFNRIIDTLLFGILYYIVTRRCRFNSRFRNLFVYKTQNGVELNKKKMWGER